MASSIVEEGLGAIVCLFCKLDPEPPNLRDRLPYHHRGQPYDQRRRHRDRRHSRCERLRSHPSAICSEIVLTPLWTTRTPRQDARPCSFPSPLESGLSAGNGLHRSLAPTEAVSQAHRSAVQRAVPFGRTYFLVSSYFSTPSASEFHCSADRSITRLLWGSSVLAANSAHAAALAR
jgi:hypothetical protein